MAKAPTDVRPGLVAEYLKLRAETNRLGKRRDEVSKLLRDALEDGGPYIDEVSGQRLTLDVTPRWEWDHNALYWLVTEHLILPDEYAAALSTSIDKDAVQEWVNKGLVSQRNLDRANAKKISKVVKQIKVSPIG